MKRAIVLLLALLVAPTPPLADEASPPPNILLIVADDLGYGSLGAYGSERIATTEIAATADPRRFDFQDGDFTITGRFVREAGETTLASRPGSFRLAIGNDGRPVFELTRHGGGRPLSVRGRRPIASDPVGRHRITATVLSTRRNRIHVRLFLDGRLVGKRRRADFTVASTVSPVVIEGPTGARFFVAPLSPSQQALLD